MLCKECGKNEASIQLTTIVNGEKSEKMICSECMAKYKNSIHALEYLGLGEILSSLFAPNISTTRVQSTLKCDKCGTTYDEFQTSGKLGCMECYKQFRTPLETMLKRIHGSTEHTGRIPKGVSALTSAKRELERLKEELVKAIACEDFESAAKIRDTIRELQTITTDVQGGVKND